jgi:hypothetical protein
MATVERISTDYRSARQGRIGQEVRRAEEAQASQKLAFATAILIVVMFFQPAAFAQSEKADFVAAEEAKEAQSESVAPVAEDKNPAVHAMIMKTDVWNSHLSQVPSYLPEAQFQFANETLQLSDVIASLYRSFPVIEQARLQAGVTAGQSVSAWGAYDTKIEGYTLNQPLGFYETYRHGLGAARQTWWGGYLGAGYRIGRGNFEPWYKERQTNDGGEFKLALIQPLLQGRAIDAQRVEIFQANLRRMAVTPEVQANILLYSLEAAEAYWYWQSAGAILKAQYRLLELADVRRKQLEALLAAEQGKQIDLILNDQLIADRRGKVIETEQKLWQAAAKLSLYPPNFQPFLNYHLVRTKRTLPMLCRVVLNSN